MSLLSIIKNNIFPLASVKTQARLVKTCSYFADMQIIDEKVEMERKKRMVALRKRNPLWEIIFHYPDKDWNIKKLLKNRNTLYENLVVFNKQKPFNMDWGIYSKNPNLNVRIIQSHIYEEWDFMYIFSNGSYMSLDFVNVIKKYNYENDISNYYFHPKMSKQFVAENMQFCNLELFEKWQHLDWNFVFTHMHDNMDIDIVEIAMQIDWIDDHVITELQNRNLYDQLAPFQPLIEHFKTGYAQYKDLYLILHDNKNFIKNIFADPKILFDLIEQNPEHEWNFSHMHLLKDLNQEFIQKHIDKQWNFPELTKQKMVSTEMILHNYKNWNIKYFCKHYPITVKQIRDNFQFPWNFAALSANKSFTWEIIKNNQDILWTLDGFCKNPNLTLDIIKNNEHLNWNFNLISSNKF
jgi:hypothetical protein